MARAAESRADHAFQHLSPPGAFAHRIGVTPSVHVLVGVVWILAAVAMAAGQFLLAAPYTADALLAATAVTLLTSGPMLLVAWGLAIRHSSLVATMAAFLGVGVTGLMVLANSIALAKPPPAETLLVGGLGALLGIAAWIARVDLRRSAAGTGDPSR